MRKGIVLSIMTALCLMTAPTWAAWMQYGDADVLGTGTYGSDPMAGATLEGLTAGSYSYASLIKPHGFPFSPSAGDYAGTDQIYVGSVQTAYHDGYSGYSGRKNGPQVITMDYSSLVPTGDVVDTLTLGIGADDFQYNYWYAGKFTASVNGVEDSVLEGMLNGLNQTGPRVQFLTIGIDTAILNPSNILTLSIDQVGDGGDGWAIDYLTTGVTSSPSQVPEPSSIVVVAGGLASLIGMLKRKA